MASTFYNMLVFAICFQAFCYLSWAFKIFGPSFTYPYGDASTLNNLNDMFAITAYSALIGGVGVLTGIAALLLRQGTYALYAVMIFVFGIFFKLVTGFVTAIPNTISAIIAIAGGDAINPMPGQANPIFLVVGMFTVFGAFFYLAEMATQRKLT